MDLNQYHELATAIEAGSISLARGGEYPEYRQDRESLLNNSIFDDVIPRFVKSCRDSDALYAHMKAYAQNTGAYSRRTDYIRTAFTPLMERIESLKRGTIAPETDIVISDVPRARFHLERAQQLIETDPESALTKARYVLESVCKKILGDLGEQDYDSLDLQPLVKLTGQKLELELEAKGFAGISTMVNILAEVRNKYSDAHGGGEPPSKSLAQFAVSQATSVYFLQHHSERQ